MLKLPYSGWSLSFRRVSLVGRADGVGKGKLQEFSLGRALVLLLPDTKLDIQVQGAGT